MLQAQYTSKFKKDVKLMKKRGKKMQKMRAVMEMVLAQKKLPTKYREHKLVGNYVARNECHLEPDWLLIYKTLEDAVVFERTGSHSDLFD